VLRAGGRIHPEGCVSCKKKDFVGERTRDLHRIALDGGAAERVLQAIPRSAAYLGHERWAAIRRGEYDLTGELSLFDPHMPSRLPPWPAAKAAAVMASPL
jgi:hypothetical protein